MSGSTSPEMKETVRLVCPGVDRKSMRGAVSLAAAPWVGEAAPREIAAAVAALRPAVSPYMSMDQESDWRRICLARSDLTLDETAP